METLKAGKAFKTILICMFFLLFLSFSSEAAEVDDGLAECAKFKDDAVKRLECFDNLAKQKTAVKDVSPPGAVAESVPKESSTAESVMSRQWELEGKKAKSAFFALKPYRPNYFLPVAYNSSPNDNTPLDMDPEAKAQHNEAKFQLSFKINVWRDLLKDTLKYLFKKDIEIDIWVAYTQLSFWQLYNSAFSSPFRDTNYEPEMLINWRTKYSILDDFKLQFVNVGFNHQSNGRSLPLSRSWNRIVANAGFEKGNFNLLLKTWYRLPEENYNDDNPDITRYMGYGEIWGIYYWKENRFAIMLRNNLRQNNLGAVQLDWSIPMSLIVKKFYDWGVPLSLETCDKLKDFSFYFQYFNGYGESLLDYNTSINRFSAGMMLVDWN